MSAASSTRLPAGTAPFTASPEQADTSTPTAVTRIPSAARDVLGPDIAAQDPSAWEHDGVANFTVALESGTAAAVIELQILIDSGAPAGFRYVNLAFEPAPDSAAPAIDPWAIRNLPVDIAHSGLTVVDLPPLAIATNGPLPEAATLWVSVSRSPLDQPDWSDAAAFEDGELEKYEVGLPLDVVTIPGVRCPASATFAPPPFRVIECTITNLGHAGPVRWTASASAESVYVPDPSGELESLGRGEATTVGLVTFAREPSGNLVVTVPAPDFPFDASQPGILRPAIVQQAPSVVTLAAQELGADCPGCLGDAVGDNAALSHPDWVGDPKPWTDIVDAWAYVVDDPSFAAMLASSGTVPCGHTAFAGPDSHVICAPRAEEAPTGPMLVAGIRLQSAPPMSDPSVRLTYTMVADADGVDDNNFTYFEPFRDDPYQGTDRWYELQCQVGACAMEVTEVDGMAFAAPSSESRILVLGDEVWWVVPLNEFTAAPVAIDLRLVAFSGPSDGSVEGAASMDVTGETNRLIGLGPGARAPIRLTVSSETPG